MAKVELIDFTGKGRIDEKWHAADLLIYTKNARLGLDAGRLEHIKQLDEKTKMSELEYMATTIPSSWEFADVTFLISGVSRAAAQQITRTRTGSYAMQSQRVVDVSGGFEAVNPFDDEVKSEEFEDAVDDSLANYQRLISAGASPGDARGVLPMNSGCNLIAKYNLRSFVELMRSRESLRTQGEYRDIAGDMKKAVLKVWPWSESFFVPKNTTAIRLLESAAQEFGITVAQGAGWKIAKAIDLLRKE